MDSGETSLVFFASSLRYPALILDERVAAPTPPRADHLLLFSPVVHTPSTPSSSSSDHSVWRRSSRALSFLSFIRFSEMFGGRQVLLLEVKGAVQAPDADPLDSAPEIEKEDAAPVGVLRSPRTASPGRRSSVVVGSRAVPIRTRRLTASSLPISIAVSPTSSTSRMLVFMSR